MNNQNIKIILEDLYIIDPELRNHESQLKEMILQLVKNKPDTKFDSRFAAKLKKDLLNKVSDQQATKLSPWLITWYSAVGVAVVAIAISASLNYSNELTAKLGFAPETRFAFEGVAIRQISDGAFGLLAAPNQTAGGFGGGGGLSSISRSAIEPSVAPDGKMMPIYPPNNYKFTFEGDLGLPEEGRLPVLKRIKGASVSGQVSSILNSMDLGVADLSTFSGTTLRNFEIGQNSDLGYIVNVNLTEGNIFISQNWEYWKRMTPQCNDQACWERERVKFTDMPTDEEAIALAKDFTQKHRIDMSHFGEPIVDQNWRIMYEKSADKSTVYFPDVITVTFPLKIENKTVYEEFGNNYGMQVYINVKMNMVTGLGNLTSQNYNSSLYEVEQDKSKLMKLIEQGGMYGYFGDSSGSTVEIKLGAPEIAWEKIWVYNNDENQELLVPAMVFPVISAEGSDPSFIKQNVVIPIAKDVINQLQPSGPVLYQTK